MAEEPEPTELRVTDKRGQNKKPEPEPEQGMTEAEREFREGAAKQAAAAEQEDATQSLRCVCFSVLVLDHAGVVHHITKPKDIERTLANISVDREPEPQDVITMSAHLWTSVQGREAASQMMLAMHTQAQQAMAARMPQNGMMPVDARVHRAAQKKH